MPTPSPRVTVDGLWRCLCPSVDPLLLTRPFETQLALISPRRPRTRATASCTRSAPATARTRLIYHDAATSIKSHDLRGPGSLFIEKPSPNAPSRRKYDDYPTTVDDLLWAKPPYNSILAKASIDTIYGALLELRKTESNIQKTAAFIAHLIRVRHQKPDVRMYESLIQANAGRTGSADALVDILEGLDEHSVAPSAYLCHAVLRVLVNHPDYLVREDVLRIMKAFWYELRPHGQYDIMLGLLRDGQYEVAMDKLEQHFSKYEPLPSFVMDIFVYKFAELGLFDDALRIIHHRLRHISGPECNPSAAQWFYLLERAAEDMHYKTVRYVWKRQVLLSPKKEHVTTRSGPGSRDKISPTDGMIENILVTASRHGDISLVMQAMRLLTQRGAKLYRPHYETLIECYAAGGQLQNAITALSIMHKARCVPTRATTRPVFLALMAQPELLDRAIGWLLPQTVDTTIGSKTVYTACPQAFAVALEAVLHLRGCDGPTGAMEMLERAVEENIVALDADCFNVVLRGSVDVNTVISVEKLMKKARVAINAESLNLFLSIYSEHGSYSSARRWGVVMQEMMGKEENLMASVEAATKFVYRALCEQDRFVLGVVRVCIAHGLLLHPGLLRKVFAFSNRGEVTAKRRDRTKMTGSQARAAGVAPKVARVRPLKRTGVRSREQPQVDPKVVSVAEDGTG